MKIRFEWFYNKETKSWLISIPTVNLFSSKVDNSRGYCLSVNIVFFNIDFWFGSKKYLKEI